MKKILLLLIPLLKSCNHNYGYIYDDETQKPLEGVVVQDVLSYENKVITDKKGFFLLSDCGDLIVFKEGYIKDTLPKYGCKPNGKCFNGKRFYIKRKN